MSSTAEPTTYTVPTEMTPFTYQIVLDLSIPVADRCQDGDASDRVRRRHQLGELLGAAQLPTIDLTAGTNPETGMPGTPCRQSPDRALDLQARTAGQARRGAWPEEHQRYYMLYFNNLRAPLPETLAQSLGGPQSRNW